METPTRLKQVAGKTSLTKKIGPPSLVIVETIESESDASPVGTPAPAQAPPAPVAINKNKNNNDDDDDEEDGKPFAKKPASTSSSSVQSFSSPPSASDEPIDELEPPPPPDASTGVAKAPSVYDLVSISDYESDGTIPMEGAILEKFGEDEVEEDRGEEDDDSDTLGAYGYAREVTDSNQSPSENSPIAPPASAPAGIPKKSATRKVTDSNQNLSEDSPVALSACVPCDISKKSATLHRETTRTYIPDRKPKASPKKKQKGRPKKTDTQQSKMKDQATQDRLIKESSKVYGPWPGDKPATDGK
jgi:hypothetical protein